MWTLAAEAYSPCDRKLGSPQTAWIENWSPKAPPKIWGWKCKESLGLRRSIIRTFLPVRLTRTLWPADVWGKQMRVVLSLRELIPTLKFVQVVSSWRIHLGAKCLAGHSRSRGGCTKRTCSCATALQYLENWRVILIIIFYIIVIKVIMMIMITTRTIITTTTIVKIIINKYIIRTS